MGLHISPGNGGMFFTAQLFGTHKNKVLVSEDACLLPVNIQNSLQNQKYVGVISVKETNLLCSLGIPIIC